MKGKNLIDNYIGFTNNNVEIIISVEINQYTLNYLNEKNFYGFSDVYNNKIPIIINDDLNNFEIKFNREKVIKSTEYEPYNLFKSEVE